MEPEPKFYESDWDRTLAVGDWVLCSYGKKRGIFKIEELIPRFINYALQRTFTGNKIGDPYSPIAMIKPIIDENGDAVPLKKMKLRQLDAAYLTKVDEGKLFEFYREAERQCNNWDNIIKLRKQGGYEDLLPW